MKKMWILSAIALASAVSANGLFANSTEAPTVKKIQEETAPAAVPATETEEEDVIIIEEDEEEEDETIVPAIKK